MPVVKTDYLLKVCLLTFTSFAGATPVLAQGNSSVPATETAEASQGATPTAGTGGLHLDMKLEDLAKQDIRVPGLSEVVNTVERQESTVGRSPAAVFVITPEMIKRSGARNIPDVLRMAPGIQVARINASTWAITARGFNDRIANFLLVQIDGRVVYQATFGGIYWNQQDVVLEDVERIEVIRGPGTTMWGSNAVNGVINIITKKSSDTQGALIQSGGGENLQRNFNTGRYGGRLSEDLTYRVFGQQFDNAEGWNTTDVHDAWHMKHGGFRMDYTPTDDDTFTLQGDIFNGKGGEQLRNVAMPVFPFSETVNDATRFPGGNILARYTKIIDDETSWQLMGYYDYYEQNYSLVKESRTTYNVDLQYQFSPADYHQFIVGGFYRASPDELDGGFTIQFDPPRFVTQWASVFAQDTMTLEEDRWYFTLGCRLEQNTFGKFQVEPTARLLFLPTTRQSAWMAVSRAVRNPTRLDTQSRLLVGVDPNAPVYVELLGSREFVPENVISYEAGYRVAPTDDLSFDLAGYVSDYTKLFSATEQAPVFDPNGEVFIPFVFGNKNHARTYGAELTSTVILTDAWQLTGSYSVFHIDGPDDGVFNSTPQNQLYLRSSWDLNDLHFDLIGRYVDCLAIDVPKYFEVDARLAWQATETLEFSVVGQNLLDSHHLEFTDGTYLVSSQVPRGWYAMVSWSY